MADSTPSPSQTTMQITTPSTETILGILCGVFLISTIVLGVLYWKCQSNKEMLRLQANLRYGTSERKKKDQDNKNAESRKAVANKRYASSAGSHPSSSVSDLPVTSTSTSAYQGSFPDSQDPDNSTFPSLKQHPGRGESEEEYNDGNSSSSSLIEVDKLMPASWRGPVETGACAPGEREDETEWTKYAPSKQSFNKYITAAGSARLSLNTRSPMGRQIGIANPLRPGVAVPLGGYQSDFLDTDMRQSLIYDATGMYPQSIAC